MLSKATGLSLDIWSMIIDYVHRPADLKNLCLTCTQLHHLSARKLYREVTLDVGSASDQKLCAFLSPRNIGLQYVRGVDIFLAQQEDKSNQLQQAHLAVRMILEFLPEGILERFSWHPWQPFSSDNLLLLFKMQRRLKWLEGFSVDGDILDQLEGSQELDRICQNARTLVFYPDSPSVLDYCNLLLRKSSRVEDLTVNASFDGPSSHLTSRELNDSSIGPGLISTTLFNHMLPFEQCSPLTLTSLKLQKINLRYATESYCKVIRLKALKTLAVLDCPGADALFAALSKGSTVPEHLEKLEVRHEDNRESDVLHAVDNLLCLLTGLDGLTIDISNVQELPSVSSITRHSKTLVYLNVHTSSSHALEEHVFSADDFNQICIQCHQIEQLSLAFPSTSMLRARSEPFMAFQNAITELRNLVTLNITTWPHNGISGLRLSTSTYKLLLQDIAQTMLSPSHSITTSSRHSGASKLNLIAFGCANSHDIHKGNSQMVFVKGRQRDPLGVDKPLATNIEPYLRKFVEPRSEILDFALSTSVRAPTKEDGGI
ncbi:hypothetical protein K490DRAFT_64460 [Saccharata proteae CBS 121410]|uniref:F-box domain-containing protein n=1 Tax=Saccharata proteae CBS 121410 TaxID=1314787 RepID=A0A9P4LY45_9PEZI|nr:hypothetical protein K490DRAFT_64460 [Saccharata proteae CBS 121410]